MHMTQIVGIALVRNEDAHLRRVIENVAGFCDRLVIADHRSTDDTPRIIEEAKGRYPQIESHTIASARESHTLIQKYAGTSTWVFGVDGDEIYDPAGLAEMRKRLVDGEYDMHWMILGNVLNCDFVDPPERVAKGYLAPPCRSVTKLYNFQLIRSWDGDTPERLHGGRIDFLPGHDASARLNLHEATPWAESPFRCLHTCFTARSSLDAAPSVRENIMDVHAAGPLKRLRRWWRMLRGRPVESDWKYSRYGRGERVTIDASPFFP